MEAAEMTTTVLIKSLPEDAQRIAGHIEFSKQRVFQ
jgi:hypothetical protein